MTMAYINSLSRASREPVEGLKVGAEITYSDRLNNNIGLVYEVGSMVKVAWTDKPGLSEVPASGIKNDRFGWRLTGRFEPAEAAFAARDIAQNARKQTIADNERKLSEREVRQEAGKKMIEQLAPPGAVAAIIAEYEVDDCDGMSDYYATKTEREVLLGFSMHKRDLFSEMRKAAKASGFTEVQHLVDGGKDTEHREKYSMGAGYYLKDGHRYNTGWTIKKKLLTASYQFDQVALIIMEENGNQLPNKVKSAEDPPCIVCGAPESGHDAGCMASGCTMRENAKFNGIELIFDSKPSDEIRECMKNVGFRWHRKKKIWYAKDKPETRAVAEDLAGTVEYSPERKAETVATIKKSNGDKLRAMADSMSKAIDSKFNSGVSQQNPTARRARIAASMREDGEALQRVQSVLYGLADSVDASTLPECLKGINSKAVVTDLLNTRSYRDRYPERNYSGGEDAKKRFAKANITDNNFVEVTDLLLAYINPPTEAEQRAKMLASLEQELIGVKIDGFFPTPRPVIDIMLQRAGIEQGDCILEPSAGKGDIADAVCEQYPGNEIRTIEVNYTLREVLKAKGHEIISNDFMQLDSIQKFDRIIMNPPFEKLTDIDHIKRAFQHLRDGGRLVSIMSESPFFRSDRKAVEFREWLNDVNGYSEKLEQGSFKGAESFRQTGVSGRIVVIDKP